MSAFDDFMRESFTESLEVFGTKPFFIGDANFVGSFSSLGLESYRAVIGGQEMPVNLSVSCQLAQFGNSVPKPETRIKVGSARYVIDAVNIDDAAQSLTITLADPNAK